MVNEWHVTVKISTKCTSPNGNFKSPYFGVGEKISWIKSKRTKKTSSFRQLKNELFVIFMDSFYQGYHLSKYLIICLCSTLSPEFINLTTHWKRKIVPTDQTSKNIKPQQFITIKYYASLSLNEKRRRK